MLRFLANFRANTKGLAAIEFAMMVPVMLVTYFGISEVANYVLAARKVASVASTGADLVAQDTNVTNDEMNDIMLALNVILAPFDVSKAQFRLTCVEADSNGNTTVAWSDARNTSPRTPGSAISMPAGLVPNDQGIVMAEISFTYQTLFGMYLTNGMTVDDTFYLKPRRSITVLRSP